MHRATHQSRRNANPRYGRPDPVRFTARRPDGTPCKRWATHGTTGCRSHGAGAPQVKAAAQRRLQQAVDAIIARMIGFALENGVPDDIALKAVIAAADRAGFSVKTSATLKFSANPLRSS